MNVYQLYQQAKRLVEAKRYDIERSMMEVESKVTRALSDTSSNHTWFQRPSKCV
jgi:hypothetical protein